MKTFLVAALGVLIVSVPLTAHHGTAASYDHTKTMLLKGTVTEFIWANPHAQLHFTVKDATGKDVSWAGECQSPGVLARQGYNKKMFQPGDEVILTVYPSKVGSPVGEVIMPKGIVVNGKQVVPVSGGNAE